MLLDIGGYTIDLSKVMMVGTVGGDPSWRSYEVHFQEGKTLVVYQERLYADGRSLPQMKRENFIALWKEHKEAQ